MKIKNLCVSYDKKKIIDDLSIEIERGQKVAIMGKSGEGKTTLLKAIANLIDYGGKIDGDEKCAFVFQSDKLVGELSAKENLEIVNPNCDAKGLLTQMGLKDKINAQVKNLSGGMSRRVAFARAFAYDAEVILADEPFSGLDIATKCDIMDKAKELLSNKTLLLVTHDLFEAKTLCSTIAIMNNGKIARVFDSAKITEQEIVKFLQSL